MIIAERPIGHDICPAPEKEKLSGIAFGRYLPERKLTNEEIASWDVKTASGKILTGNDIEQRVGVQFRYVASEKEGPLSMGLEAAQKALRNKPGKIDAIMATTNFPLGQNLSTEIKREFGISGPNWDVHAACAGFGFSLNHIKKHEDDFLGKRILFVSAERVSPYLQDLRSNAREDGSLKDPSLSQTIFSDGAVAMIVDYGKDMKVLFSSVCTFPKDTNDIIKIPVNRSLLREPYLTFPSPYAESKTVEQDGKRVYELMRKTIPSLIRNELGTNNLQPSDFKGLDLHQGSGHMVEVLAKLLPDFSVSRDYYHGNNSSGAIPEIWRKASLKNEIRKGDRRMGATFGAGLLAVTFGVEFG